MVAADLDEIEGPPSVEETARALHSLRSDRQVRHIVHPDGATGETTLPLTENAVSLWARCWTTASRSAAPSPPKRES
ncbi:hypothetical protein [Streptomyces sp. NPDC058572]|uniref:hypothetical protein n=1 Tax=Streptomyces sp. NPDC058572 TaxID=3346546 RepID=UPI003663AB00